MLTYKFKVGIIATHSVEENKIMFNWFKKKALEDYDYTNNLCSGNNSTRWDHGEFCTTCLSIVSHREFMTSICLTCGTETKYPFPSGCYRKIYLGGKWVEQVRVNGVDYLDKKKVEENNNE